MSGVTPRPAGILRPVTIATAIFLIAIGAILRYAINVHSDVIDIQTVGLILMIAGGAGLALSLLYELVRQRAVDVTATSTRARGGYDDPTRRLVVAEALAAGEGLAERDLVGVLEVGADRQPAGEP